MKKPFLAVGCIFLLALVFSVDARGGTSFEPAASPSRESTEAMSLAVVRPAVELVADGQDAGLPATVQPPTTATAPADVAQLGEQPRRNGQVESSSPSVSSITYDGHLSYADFDAVLTAAGWPTDPGLRAVAYSIACGDDGVSHSGESRCEPDVSNGEFVGLFGVWTAWADGDCHMPVRALYTAYGNALCARIIMERSVALGRPRWEMWGR